MKRCIIMFVLLAMLFVAASGLAPCVLASAIDETVDAVSSGDVSGGDVGDFVRVPMVPLNVEIPEFYQEVVNISGMYIFILPDGTVYKRIYGALDGVFGWYEPVGPDNIVYSGSEIIDIEDDRKLYADAGGGVDPNAGYVQDYVGIFRPDEGVTTVVNLFGVPLATIFIGCAGGVLLLCVVILIASRAAAARATGQSPQDGNVGHDGYLNTRE